MSQFPETRLSLFEAVRSGDADVRRGGFDALVAVYWRPVYTYLRMHWRASADDAEDLTQGFFTYAFEKTFLEQFDPSRARFRTWLRTGLDAYVQRERRNATRLKRGGGATAVPLDFAALEAQLGSAAASPDADPETLFHQEWVRALFAEALADTRRELDARAQGDWFAIFEQYDLADGPRPRYAELAATLGMSATDVTNRLAAVRRRFRARVLDRLRSVTGSDAEFQSEAAVLLGRVPDA